PSMLTGHDLGTRWWPNPSRLSVSERRKRNRKTTETREWNDDGEVALMAYATESDLADYLGVSLADLPPDADRLLKRASEDIDYWTLGRAMQCEATKLAACAQVEMWL